MRFIYIFIVSLFLFSSCVTYKEAKPVEDKKPPEISEKKELTPQEQDVKAIGLFEKVLDASLEDREKAIPSMIKYYEDIIRCCPDAPITQECYWRLIEMYLYDIKPPEIEKAKLLNDQFLVRYSDSAIKNFIEDSFMKFFYQKGLWERLLTLPKVKEALTSGNSYHLFLYSEANFNLGRIKEAEGGYKRIIEKAPNSQEAVIAKKRLGL